MKRICIALCAAVLPLLAQKHIFNLAEPLTSASALPPREIGDSFLRSLAGEYNLTPDDFSSVYVAKEYRTEHNGVTHLVYKQHFQGIDAYNGEWTVNIDRAGRVINAGGQLFPNPGPGLALPDPNSAREAVRKAASAVNPDVAERFMPFQTQARPGEVVRFAPGGFAGDVAGTLVWYGVNGALRPAWLFYVLDEDGFSYYATIVDSATQGILLKQNLTHFQAAAPRGLVFERESPQPNPTPGVRLTQAPPIVNRTVQAFTGDPLASPLGWVAGTETAGNNVIAGSNLLGILFDRPSTAVSPARDFSFPLQLGPDAPNPTNFASAAATNAFYWANRAHDLFFQLGFNEAAGNFQQQNGGRGGVDGDPMLVYTEFRAARAASSDLSNSYFLSRSNDDGTPVALGILLSQVRPSGLFLDLAYDAEVILHEYTHGVSHRLVRQVDTFQGAAMGEAWSDFFALEFLTPEGAPPDGIYPFGEYFDQMFGVGDLRTRPYSTNTDINPLTYRQLGHVTSRPEVHADGEIWVEALWDLRANLIKQFGDREGRRRARLLVIDGMKLSPPAPSMVDMRDAILLADRVDFNGASQDQLWAAFAKRGLGVLARSGNADSVHVLPSFEVPSPAGSIRFYEDPFVIGETVRIVLQDSNLTSNTALVQVLTSSGDLENINLRRQGPVYVGSIRTAFAPANRQNGRIELVPGDGMTAYYQDADAGGGVRRQIETTVGTIDQYVADLAAAEFRFGQETALSLRTVLGSRLVALPFDFPYFGKKYSYVRVYNNGILTFDLPDFSPCNDVNSLALLNAIAPMWMFLATNGRAQPNEDVYLSRGADSVTFRWAAETFPLFPFADPEPVNFAATLYSDGRIKFNYGPGNKNLVAGSQLSGCPASTPTVGLSNGHESFVEIAVTHDSVGTLENAPTLLLNPPFGFSGLPTVRLESPLAGQTFQGVLTGSGVVYDSDASVLRVDVLIDGIARTTARTGGSRPDFCATQNVRGCPNVGFTFTLNFDSLGLAPGSHRLQLRATNSRGGWADFPETPLTFQVQAGQSRLPRGTIEEPANGAQVSGTVAVRGYVVADDLRVTAVDVLVDGVTYGRASYGLTRQDVCGSLPGAPNCPRVGFAFDLNTTEGSVLLANGRHSLQVRALDETGRYTLIPDQPLTINVNNPVVQPAVGVLTSPKNSDRLTGVVRISGYAYRPGGRIERALLFVDDINLATIPYGQPRPEECSRLPTSVPARISDSVWISTRAAWQTARTRSACC